MDLFLETPQQKADRILRQQERLLEMQAQAVADPYDGARGGRGDAFADEGLSGGDRYSSEALFGDVGEDRSHRTGGLFGRGASSEAAAHDARSEDYSVQQEEYRRELDYDRGRARRRTARARLRTLAMVVIVPLGLVAIFLVSYSLTCILNGATPDEIVQHLATLVARIESTVRTIVSSA